jgi:hypothetical protein
MSFSGLLIMIASISTVGLLFGWSLWRVVTQPDEEVDTLSTAELHTPDMDDPG